MDQAASLVKNGKLQLEMQNSKNLQSITAKKNKNQILDIKKIKNL
jgi:hypothetical protein